ncbi:MAG: M15 family metallopeptidase, partial [Casimicrobium sp.]
GPVELVRYRNDRYEVRLPEGSHCDNVGVRTGWIEKKFIGISDKAYEPLLTRVVDGAGLKIDMAYAGQRIFCEGDKCLINQSLYGQPRCYLNPQAAEKLKLAALAIQARDSSLKLRVLDCYRPVDVQIEMFKRVSNPEWVAQPKPPRYGGHNRGVAIDVTIERDGRPLDMGSAFDSFNEISNYDAKNISDVAKANRKLLRETMIGVGLRPYDGEWWHFSLPIETRAMNFPL